jgi:hypothetical protein
VYILELDLTFREFRKESWKRTNFNVEHFYVPTLTTKNVDGKE